MLVDVHGTCFALEVVFPYQPPRFGCILLIAILLICAIAGACHQTTALHVLLPSLFFLLRCTLLLKPPLLPLTLVEPFELDARGFASERAKRNQVLHGNVVVAALVACCSVVLRACEGCCFSRGLIGGVNDRSGHARGGVCFATPFEQGL